MHALSFVVLMLIVPAHAAEPVNCGKLIERLSAQGLRRPYPAHHRVPGACGDGGEALTVVWSADDDPVAVHVISVHAGDGSSGGGIDVDVRPSPRPMILVLNSVEFVNWKVHNHGAVLEKVITQGPDSVALDGYTIGDRFEEDLCLHVAEGGRPLGRQSGGEYHLMMTALQSFTGHKETSFQSCHAGNRFEVPPPRKGAQRKIIQAQDEDEEDWKEGEDFFIELHVLPEGPLPAARPEPERRPREHDEPRRPQEAEPQETGPEIEFELRQKEEPR
ncbi:MAG: hypothetical protein ABII00_15385 [Elusimicrobiota bacterium]